MAVTSLPETALGMVETRGLVASVEAADAMIKMACVWPVCWAVIDQRPAGRRSDT